MNRKCKIIEYDLLGRPIHYYLGYYIWKAENEYRDIYKNSNPPKELGKYVNSVIGFQEAKRIIQSIEKAKGV